MLVSYCGSAWFLESMTGGSAPKFPIFLLFFLVEQINRQAVSVHVLLNLYETFSGKSTLFLLLHGAVLSGFMLQQIKINNLLPLRLPERIMAEGIFLFFTSSSRLLAKPSFFRAAIHMPSGSNLPFLPYDALDPRRTSDRSIRRNPASCP